MRVATLITIGLLLGSFGCASDRTLSRTRDAGDHVKAIEYPDEAAARQSVESLLSQVAGLEKAHLVFVLPSDTPNDQVRLFRGFRDVVPASAAVRRSDPPTRYLVITSFVVRENGGSFTCVISDSPLEPRSGMSNDVHFSGYISKEGERWVVQIVTIGIA
jgi:hypothetical protein